MGLGVVIIPLSCPWGCPADEPLWKHLQLQGCASHLLNLGALSSMAKPPSPLLDGTGTALQRLMACLLGKAADPSRYWSTALV